MDVETHNDVENQLDVEIITYVENPMNVEIVPVAQVIGIEVLGEVLFETRPKPQPQQQQSQLSCYEKINFYASMTAVILFMLLILGGFVLFMIWFCNPHTLGASEW